jgi:ribosome-binding protein aMBF1 (putative translation factor)
VVKLSDLKDASEVLRDQLKDAAFSEEWGRTAPARAVGLKVVAYRAEHGLSQSQLAGMLNVSQPLGARLETGEHDPTLTTLSRLSRHLGIEFHSDITPDSLSRTA